MISSKPNSCRWAELSTERLHFLCEVLRITLTTFQYRVSWSQRMNALYICSPSRKHRILYSKQLFEIKWRLEKVSSFVVTVAVQNTLDSMKLPGNSH